jgi:O-antigen/teichoic acid export membrane protein
MFIVIPHLTKQPSLYGVYALCMSSTIFLNYADLGFLSSCQKYAAESYSLNKRKDEMQYIAFGGFILLFVVILISVFFTILSYYPHLLIKNFASTDELHIAKKLFLLLALFSPITIFNRISSIIFEIRIEGYIPQRVSIIQSVLSILSVFYFFRINHFDLLQYFIFISFLNIISTGINFVIIQKRYKYDLIYFFKCIKFNKNIYNKSKKLAYSGLYVVFVWIIYNEMDQFMIAKIFGIDKVAFFAIAISITTLFRTIYSFIYSPFSARANYFIADGDENGLKLFFNNIILLTMPIIFIPTITFFFFSKFFVISWVGFSFKESIPSFQLMTLIYSLSFITFPISMFLITKEKIREMYFISTLQPVVYWIGIYFTYNKLGILSFALFKLITVFISDTYYTYIYMKYFHLNFKYILNNLILPVIFFTIICYIQFYLYSKFLNIISQDKFSLIYVIISMSATVLITLLLYFFINNKFSKSIKNIIYKV